MRSTHVLGKPYVFIRNSLIMWNRTFLSKNATVSCKHLVKMSFFLLLNLRGVHALGKKDGHMTWSWKRSAGHLNAKFMSCAVNFDWMVISSSKRVVSLDTVEILCTTLTGEFARNDPFRILLNSIQENSSFSWQQMWCLFRIDIICNHTVELLQIRTLPTSKKYKHLFDPT